MKPLLCLTLFAALLAGCTRMYDTPEIENGFEFAGVRDIVAPGEAARMIFSHGMCSGNAGRGWAERRLTRIADLVGGEPGDLTGPRKFPNDVERYDATLNGAQGRRYELTFLVYGRPIDAARKALEKDSGRQSADEPDKPRRASINSGVRDVLMNDCLVDAVFYLGPNGDAIRSDVRSFWCDYLGGTVIRASGRLNQNTTCQINRAAQDADTPVFLIPESLGSKVLFDAYRQVDVRGRVNRAQALGPVGGVHLVTNQLLLLDQAGLGGGDTTLRSLSREAPGAGGVLGSFLDDATGGTSFRTLSRAAPSAPLPVVAYTDPNDALGYRLDPDGAVGGSLFINVLLSNTGTFLPGAPTLANPIDAHRGAEQQDAIFEMILDGSDRKSGGDQATASN